MKLSDSITSLPLVGSKYLSRLEKLGISTISDLFYHIPSKYIDYRNSFPISRVKPGDVGTIKGEVLSIKNVYTKFGKKFQIAEVKDVSGKLQIIWFNQPFLSQSITVGEHYSFSGKIDWFSNKLSMISPEYENIEGKSDTIHTGKLVPVYPETYGVSSKWLRGRIHVSWEALSDTLEDFLNNEDQKELAVENIVKAFKDIHFPKNEDDLIPAKKRLAFNELFFHQLRSLHRKNEWSKFKSSLRLSVNKKTYDEFVKLLPFTLTPSQNRSIKEIFSDLERDVPMNRLLEGDVGSGKTVVAAAACFASFVNGYQSVIMAPTQILATQHFETLNQIFSRLKLRISLITGVGIKSDIGKSDIFVGTHALIHNKQSLAPHSRNKVNFDKVAVVVIDEQHRFGVEQRAHLIQKSTKGKKVPNVLTMTATPIPRTVALTLYSDLDLSILEELPKGRVPITTWIVPPQKRTPAYDWIKILIKKEEVQAFVICPLIEESKTESMKQVKAATQEFEGLKKQFKGLKLGLLHGRQKAKEKDEILDKFRKGEIHILVSTPVVEVGIDVPNATIMIIEAGERYGLAQLHQLRGRIGRGSKKSYCLVFTTNRSQKSSQRLSALTKSLSGFELSELDLKMRGPGELLGTRQHGFPELKIASWGDTELIKKSRDFAEKVLSDRNKYLKVLDQLRLNGIVEN